MHDVEGIFSLGANMYSQTSLVIIILGRQTVLHRSRVFVLPSVYLCPILYAYI